MPSLVIHAPEYQVVQVGKKSFINTFNTGIGEGYAINRRLFGQIYPGCRVILLCNDKRCRAEGELVKLEPAMRDGKRLITKNGIPRYDVYIKNLTTVTYKPERLNHNGVAVIE
ncbi:MAG: hypothetical protein AB1610_04925 [Nitrospirota bacterium]